MIVGTGVGANIDVDTVSGRRAGHFECFAAFDAYDLIDVVAQIRERPALVIATIRGELLNVATVCGAVTLYIEGLGGIAARTDAVRAIRNDATTGRRRGRRDRAADDDRREVSNIKISRAVEDLGSELDAAEEFAAAQAPGVAQIVREILNIERTGTGRTGANE